MARYGYNYQSYSTYSTMKPSTDETFGYLIGRASVPNTNVIWEDSYDHVPKKTLIPVATKPYEDDYKHGSPTKAHYPATHDDDWRRPQKSDEFFPKRTIPVATRPHGDEYKHGKAYPVRDDDEWHRPTSPIQKRDDQYLPKRTTVPIATRPYGHDYEQVSPKNAYRANDDDVRQHRKSSPKRTMVPPGATRPYGHDYEHVSPKKAYRANDDDVWQHRKSSPKRTTVPPGATTRPYGHDYEQVSPKKAYRANDDDVWQHRKSSPKRTTVPPGATRPYGHDYEHVSPKKANRAAADDDVWQHRKSSPKRTTLPPVATRPYGSDEYKHSSSKPEAYPTRYDDKRHSPPARSIPVIATDWRRSPRSTTGHDGNYREDHKPVDMSIATGGDDKYGDRNQYEPNRNGKPVISQGWSSLPRNGTQLSEATSDIDKITEMLRKAGGVGPSTHSQADYGTNKATAVNVFRNENEDAPPRNGLDVPIDGRGRFGNLKLAGSGPGSTIDSREAVKKYNGRRV